MTSFQFDTYTVDIINNNDELQLQTFYDNKIYKSCTYTIDKIHPSIKSINALKNIIIKTLEKHNSYNLTITNNNFELLEFDFEINYNDEYILKFNIVCDFFDYHIEQTTDYKMIINNLIDKINKQNEQINDLKIYVNKQSEQINHLNVTLEKQIKKTDLLFNHFKLHEIPIIYNNSIKINCGQKILQIHEFDCHKDEKYVVYVNNIFVGKNFTFIYNNLELLDINTLDLSINYKDIISNKNYDFIDNNVIKYLPKLKIVKFKNMDIHKITLLHNPDVTLTLDKLILSNMVNLTVDGIIDYINSLINIVIEELELNGIYNGSKRDLIDFCLSKSIKPTIE